MELFHYCSNAAFLSIVEGREVWASDLSLSNDRDEGHWVKKVIKDCLIDDGDVTIDHISRIDQMIDIGILHSGAAGFCMSEKPDLLSQWRLYADDGSGISIGFSKEYFESLGELKQKRNDIFNLSIKKVIYDLEAQKSSISDIVNFLRDIIKDGGTRVPVQGILEDDESFKKRMVAWRRLIPVSIMSYFAAYSMKNPSFLDEREWRIVSHNLFTKDEVGKIEFYYRSSKDKIIPFRKLRLEDTNINPISSIYIGPKNMTSVKTIENILKLNNFDGVSVIRSTSSYR